jgi:hypothetical protein
MLHGIENFACDGLLGKPCFLVGHRELLRDHGKALSDFIARLSALHWNLRWRTVGDAVIRSYRMQRRDGMIRFKNVCRANDFREPRNNSDADYGRERRARHQNDQKRDMQRRKCELLFFRRMFAIRESRSRWKALRIFVVII